MKKKKDVDKTFESPEEFDEFMSEKPDSAPKESFIDDEPFEESAPVKETIKEADLPEMSKEDDSPDLLDVAADVPVQIVAVMGKKNITMKELAEMRMGEIVELNRPANEIVDLIAGGRLIAKGELVEIEGKLGVKVIKLIR